MAFPKWLPRTENWSGRRLDLAAGGILLIGFLLRLWAARSFVNPDEAYHVMLASPSDFGALYESAVRSPHPPLFVILLHYIRLVTESDLGIRLIPILAGCAFPWVIYRWIAKGWSRHAGLAALAILTLAPKLIQLSVEARAYTLVLLLMSLALYLMDGAIERSSPLRMTGFILALAVAVLTDYSAAFFVVASGTYFLLRIRERSVTQDVRIVWELGQVGVVILYAVLWVTQIHPIGQIAATRSDVQGWLRTAYPAPGQNAIVFVVLNTARQFAFLLPLLVPAVAAILLFLTALYLLWRRSSPKAIWRCRATVALLVIPFAAACTASFLYLFPYGRSRHTIFLALFIATGVGIALDRIGRRWIVPLAVLAAVAVPVWHLAAGQYRGEVARVENRREYMHEALRFLKTRIPPGSLILTESECRVELAYYLEKGRRLPEVRGTPSEETIGGYRLFSARWNFTSLDDLRQDLRLVRETYGLKPQDRIWIFDGGFQLLLQEPLRALERRGEIGKLYQFGRALLAFQAPAGFPEVIAVASTTATDGQNKCKRRLSLKPAGGRLSLTG